MSEIIFYLRQLPPCEALSKFIDAISERVQHKKVGDFFLSPDRGEIIVAWGFNPR
ncbi:hypothetical protein MHK_001199 [Candidatus Magnetomorum sp. HK-1]|nr:hypothetical protein MHK_001199 [Candidatus Magnetomorum sp. HK-1]